MSSFLTHGRIRLMLHRLREKPGPTLLLLHGLGEHSPESIPADVEAWPGAVFALDFTGHGESLMPHGGGYTPEVLLGDVDAALATTGPATLLGRGLGAYVALLAAAARPRLVRGVVLADGPGLSGGDGWPDPALLHSTPLILEPPDPFAIAELSNDLRPPEYVLRFVRIAVEKSGLDQPLTVAATERPAWLAAVVEADGVGEAGLEAALARYAGAS